MMRRRIQHREFHDMQMVCDVLRRLNLLHAHVPNEGKRSAASGAQAKLAGLAPGHPDLVIYDPPPGTTYRGTQLELKKVKGKKPEPDQLKWLADLQARNWLVAVAYGWRQALEKLADMGYPGVREILAEL